MQAFLDTLTIAPGPRETFLDRLADACEGRDVPGGLYNFSKFVWDKPTHHSTGGPPVARNGKVCTNMAITWSHAVESDQSAAAVGEKGQPLSKADLTALHAEYGGELIDMGGEAAVLVLRGSPFIQRPHTLFVGRHVLLVVKKLLRDVVI